MLGPPKTAFSSSSRFARTNPTGETTTGSEDTEGARSRTFGDRQQTRNSKPAGEKDGGRDWTTLRQPKVPGDTDEQKETNDRLAKFGRRDRERDNEGERRNGDKQDSRWGQREDRGGQRDERRQNGERQGGWRDRESNRQNNRGWDRDQAEKDPEWFDEPMKKQEEELGVGAAHTQADFQKWKEMMKGNKAPTEDPAPAAQPPPTQMTPAKQGAAMKLDGFSEPMFGGFGAKSTDAPLEGISASTKTAPTPVKGKSSRFASVFKKDDAPPVPVQESPAPQQPILEAAGQGQNEDKAGFQRILQMLGGANIGSPQEPSAPGNLSEPASPQIRGPAGAKQKSRFFDSAPKSPVHSPQPRFQSPGGNMPPINRGMTDDAASFFGLPAPQKARKNHLQCPSRPATSCLLNPLSIPTAVATRTLLRRIVLTTLPPVAHHRADHLPAAQLHLTSVFRTFSQPSELSDLRLRTETASSCSDSCKARDLVQHLSKLAHTKTSTFGLVSRPSLMHRLRAPPHLLV